MDATRRKLVIILANGFSKKLEIHDWGLAGKKSEMWEGGDSGQQSSYRHYNPHNQFNGQHFFSSKNVKNFWFNWF